jgi:preprotein translocase subunit SecA
MTEMFSGHDDSDVVVARVEQLGQEARHMDDDELSQYSRSILDSRKLAGDSRDHLAVALATSREVVRRVTGTQPPRAVLRVAAGAIMGEADRPASRKERAAIGRDKAPAIAMVSYWKSLPMKGAHVVVADEDSVRTISETLRPIFSLLGVSLGVLGPSMSVAERRFAYSAMITVGSISEMAADYLRDNLHDSQADVVQRELHAAIIENTDAVLGAHALSHAVITGARPDGSGGADEDAIAATFGPGVDYRVDRKQRAILLSAPAMARLRSAIDWKGSPSLTAVARAEQVEHNILRRENLVKGGDRILLADISYLHYIAMYKSVAGFSPSAGLSASVDELLRKSETGVPHSRELAFERVLSRQRAETYLFRATLRDGSASPNMIHAIVADVVDAWLLGGRDVLIGGLQGVLAGKVQPELIRVALVGSEPRQEVGSKAVSMVETAVEQRRRALGSAQFEGVVRDVLLVVTDTQWSAHLTRARFLQRQSVALYGAGPDSVQAREADVDTMFSACNQAIRVEAIKYILNVAV